LEAPLRVPEHATRNMLIECCENLIPKKPRGKEEELLYKNRRENISM